MGSGGGLPARALPAKPSFEEDIVACVPAIQDLLVRVLETHCGGGPTGISLICERLGVHRKLAWQIRNVAYDPLPVRAASFMPSPAGIQTLITALEARGAESDVTTALRQASESFSRLTTAHAGSRTEMDLLTQSHLTRDEGTAAVKWREKAFLGNSFIWGAQAKVHVAISILNRSTPKRDWIDVAQVRGLIDLRRVRPDIHWLVGQSVVLNERRRVDSTDRRALDPAAARDMGGVPVLSAFCSQPQPRLRRTRGGDGLVNDELLPAPVGFSARQTVYTGEVLRELAPAYATERNQRGLFGVASRTPSEVLLLDHFVHRDLFPGVNRELCVFGELNSPVTMADDDLLPVGEPLEFLGCGTGVARTSDVQGYLELLRWVFDRLGWDASEFELHRARFPFPPVPSSVMVRHPLPARGRSERGST